MLKKVILCPNPYRDHELTVAKEAKRILDSVHCPNVVCVPFRNEEKPEGYGLDIRPLQQELRGADMIIAFGGDGTILHEANLSLRYAKPILGINLGRCGFLATCEVSEMEAKLSAVARGEFSVDNRMLLYVRVLGHDGWEGHALNDVVVTKGRLQQAIDFSIYCDDILVEHYRGDGVIVATPTGSTAYSLAGPFWIRRPKAWSSRRSVPTVLPVRPWCLRRSAS